jgi:hypothetical protein
LCRIGPTVVSNSAVRSTSEFRNGSKSVSLASNAVAAYSNDLRAASAARLNIRRYVITWSIRRCALRTSRRES